MPSYNVTIDDASPFIQYSQGWVDSDQTDSFHNLYANNTFHATQVQGATASFTFNGTGVYLYGAMRPNHDQYSVTIDGHSVSLANGSASPDSFQQLLYGNGSLPHGLHQVILANDFVQVPSAFVDLDYVVMTMGDSSTLTADHSLTLDDSASNFTYFGSWDNTSNSFSVDYFQQTMHRTSSLNAQANLSFYGHAVSIYGATSYNHGNFTLSLDGGPAITANANATVFRPQTLLYEFDGLEDGAHYLTITNQGTDGNTFLDLDQAIVRTYMSSMPAVPSVNASANAISANPASSLNMNSAGSSGLSSSDTGAIVGIVVGVVLILLLGTLALTLFLRRRMREASRVGREQQIKHAEAGRSPDSDNSNSISPDQLVVNPFYEANPFNDPPNRVVYAQEMPPPEYEQVISRESSPVERRPEKDPRLFVVHQGSSPSGEASGSSNRGA